MPTLQFKGKTFVQNHHLAVPFHQLVPQPDKSLTEKVSLNDNLIIHGDNLTALKALLPTYAGKVKCIYIDPPYNTGNEGWVYNDNVKSPLIKEWIGKVVGKLDEDLVRHDKWLCMMMPRLKLLRDLLSDEGVIFISIDDNEAHNLKLLMDEVFGEHNFVADIVAVNNLKGRNDKAYIATAHERLLMYVRSNDFSEIGLQMPQGRIDEYKLEDEGGKYRLLGLRKRGGADTREKRPKMFFPLYVNPVTLKVSVTKSDEYSEEVLPLKSDGVEGCWRWGKSTVEKNLVELEAKIVSQKKFDVFEKDYLYADGEVKRIKPKTVLFGSDFSTDSATKKYKLIMPDSDFNNPKPVEFVKQLLSYSTSGEDIILDSFAGSGTTAQAVLELNKEDGGNRKFIAVEMEDYADSITAERVRRVIKGVPTAKNELVKKGLGGTFSYFDLGDAIEMESLLAGKTLPSYEELGRYLFYTATGEEFKPDALDESANYVGKTEQFDVYMYYKPDLEYLKTTALTLDTARELREKAGNRPLLVFAPTKYVEQQTLDELNITFCQLPFEIYRLKN